MVLHLDHLAIRLTERWVSNRLASRLHLLRPSVAFCPPVETNATQLLEALLERLSALANGSTSPPVEARLWAWTLDNHIALELRTSTALDRSWCLPRSPELGIGVARHRYQRLALPQKCRFRHCRWGAPDSVCILTPNPATIEMARGMAAALNLNGLWATPSPHRARQWLAQHPHCPLLLVETGPGDRLWFLLPDRPISPAAPWLPLPLTLSSLVLATRKFCPTL